MGRPAQTFETIMDRVMICQHGLQCGVCCWLWQGGKDRWGYGKCHYGGVYTTPHRVIYQHVTQCLLIRSQLVLHTCDIPHCCNWHHLYIGDDRDNTNDRMQRGRFNNGYRPKGTEQSQSKLNNAKVRQIRRLYASGGWTHNDLCHAFGVKKSVMQRILSKQDWRHVRPYSMLSE